MVPGYAPATRRSYNKGVLRPDQSHTFYTLLWFKGEYHVFDERLIVAGRDNRDLVD